ncbi:MAG: helix-turn-helix transcriptional regulator [Solirubrobacterales bacterium]|nr:helix-turn-helix transcriptional regulator [Solirubrobacterales bacterium]
MQITEILTIDGVLAELGRRVERHRLESNRTQAQLAEQAGIGRATLQRLERGQSVQSSSLIKVLRVLGLLGALDTALPESVELPIAELARAERRVRRRARGHRDTAAEIAPERTWSWGEQSGEGP